MGYFAVFKSLIYDVVRQDLGFILYLRCFSLLEVREARSGAALGILNFSMASRLVSVHSHRQNWRLLKFSIVSFHFTGHLLFVLKWWLFWMRNEPRNDVWKLCSEEVFFHFPRFIKLIIVCEGPFYAIVVAPFDALKGSLLSREVESKIRLKAGGCKTTGWRSVRWHHKAETVSYEKMEN